MSTATEDGVKTVVLQGVEERLDLGIGLATQGVDKVLMASRPPFGEPFVYARDVGEGIIEVGCGDQAARRLSQRSTDTRGAFSGRIALTMVELLLRQLDS